MLTILEASKLNPGEVQRNAVIEMFARESEILRILPIFDILGNAYKYNREEALPGVGFRGVNEGYSESTGVINPLMDALVIAGGDLDVDKFIVRTMGEGVRSTHEQMKVKALAGAISNAFFKGDSETNPREFDGLQKRVSGAQLIDAGDTPGGDALSLALLDEAIDNTDNPTHIFVSKAMRRAITQAAKNAAVGGNVTWGKDDFGRQIATYNDLPLVTPSAADGSDTVLGFNEAAPAGGTAQCTSVYVASIGEAKVKGIQNGTMDVRDLGELDEAPVVRTRVEWYVGLVVEHGKAVTRIRGIKKAPLVP